MIQIDKDRLSAAATAGLNLGEIANALGISKATLDRRRADDDGIDAIISEARGKAVLEVADRLRENALAGDTQAAKLWLGHAAGWMTQKKVEHEVTGPMIRLNFPTGFEPQ